MNYMLIENTTLSSMKIEHFFYHKADKIDPSPNDPERAHRMNITCMIIIRPQDIMQESSRSNAQPYKMSVSEYKKKIKFVTGDKDGIVKVWLGMNLRRDI